MNERILLILLIISIISPAYFGQKCPQNYRECAQKRGYCKLHHDENEGFISFGNYAMFTLTPFVKLEGDTDGQIQCDGRLGQVSNENKDDTVPSYCCVGKGSIRASDTFEYPTSFNRDISIQAYKKYKNDGSWSFIFININDQVFEKTAADAASPPPITLTAIDDTEWIHCGRSPNRCHSTQMTPGAKYWLRYTSHSLGAEYYKLIQVNSNRWVQCNQFVIGDYAIGLDHSDTADCWVHSAEFNPDCEVISIEYDDTLKEQVLHGNTDIFEALRYVNQSPESAEATTLSQQVEDSYTTSFTYTHGVKIGMEIKLSYSSKVGSSEITGAEVTKTFEFTLSTEYTSEWSETETSTHTVTTEKPGQEVVCPGRTLCKKVFVVYKVLEAAIDVTITMKCPNTDPYTVEGTVTATGAATINVIDEWIPLDCPYYTDDYYHRGNGLLPFCDTCNVNNKCTICRDYYILIGDECYEERVCVEECEGTVSFPGSGSNVHTPPFSGAYCLNENQELSSCQAAMRPDKAVSLSSDNILCREDDIWSGFSGNWQRDTQSCKIYENDEGLYALTTFNIKYGDVYDPSNYPLRFILIGRSYDNYAAFFAVVVKNKARYLAGVNLYYDESKQSCWKTKGRVFAFDDNSNLLYEEIIDSYADGTSIIIPCEQDIKLKIELISPTSSTYRFYINYKLVGSYEFGEDYSNDLVTGFGIQANKGNFIGTSVVFKNDATDIAGNIPQIESPVNIKPFENKNKYIDHDNDYKYYNGRKFTVNSKWIFTAILLVVILTAINCCIHALSSKRKRANKHKYSAVYNQSESEV